VATTVDQTHAIHVYNGRPGLPGTTEVCQSSYTYDRVDDVIQALANKVNVITSGPNPAGLGGIMTVTVQGDTGTVGAGPSYDPGVFAMTPAALDSWAANAYELLKTELTIPPDKGLPTVTYVNDLHFNNFSGGDRPYTIVYTFRVTGTTTGPTPVYPIQEIASGTQVKHTTVNGLDDPTLYPPLKPAVNATTLAKAVTPSATGSNGGRVTYTVTASNTGTQSVSLDDFYDTLPTGATYVPGSSTYNGVALKDPAIVGQTLTWVGPFDIPAGGNRKLVYQVDIGGTRGAQVNKAVAHIVGTQIDTTTSTFDNAPATATVTVPNDVPDARDDATSTSYETRTTINVLANDLDGDGDTLKVTPDATSAAGGTVTVDATGLVSYTPKAGFVGTDTFHYSVDDGHGGTDTATVTVTVGLPGAPAAVKDAYSTPYQTVLNVAAPGVLANDTGVGITATSVADPPHGTATVAANGALTYTPDAGWAGADTFTYTITDAFGRTSSSTVTVTTGLPAAPAAQDNSYSTPYGVTLSEPAPGVLGNDSGTGITATSVADPPHGSATVAANGALTYMPDAGWAGADTFAYTITDAFGRTATAKITVTTGLPVAPAAASDVYSTEYQTKLTVNAPGVLGNDSGTGIKVTATGTPAHGTATVAADGSLTYTPAAGWAGDDTFAYTITDAFGRTATASVTVTTNKPAAPAASNDGYSTPYQTKLTVAAPGVLGNDSGANVTVTSNTTPGHGTTSVSADGSLTYTPAAGWAGDDTFAYTITDSFGRTATASVTVTTNKPAAPVASNDGYSTPYQTKLTVAAPGVLGNDSGTGIKCDGHGHPRPRHGHGRG